MNFEVVCEFSMQFLSAFQCCLLRFTATNSSEDNRCRGRPFLQYGLWRDLLAVIWNYDSTVRGRENQGGMGRVFYPCKLIHVAAL